MIDHCIAFFRRQQEQTALEIYVTDCLKAIAENTAHAFGGSTITRRFADIINPPKEEERTAEQIISDFKRKINSLGG